MLPALSSDPSLLATENCKLHTSAQLNPLAATLRDTPSRKSFNYHSYEKWGSSKLANTAPRAVKKACAADRTKPLRLR
jgi:hypothetical protein